MRTFVADGHLNRRYLTSHYPSRKGQATEFGLIEGNTIMVWINIVMVLLHIFWLKIERKVGRIIVRKRCRMEIE